MALYASTGIVIHEIIMEIEKRSNRLGESPEDWSYLGEALDRYCEDRATLMEQDDEEEEEFDESEDKESLELDRALEEVRRTPPTKPFKVKPGKKIKR